MTMEITKLIETIPAEQVQSIMIRQVYINSFTILSILILGIVSVFFGSKLYIKGNSNFENLEGFLGFAICIVGAILTIIGLIAFPFMIMGFFNPEYAIIKEMIDII